MSQSGNAACGRLTAAVGMSFFLALVAGTFPATAGTRDATLTVRVVVVAPCGAAGGSCDPATSSAFPGTPEESGDTAGEAPLRIREETVQGRTYRTIVY